MRDDTLVQDDALSRLMDAPNALPNAGPKAEPNNLAPKSLTKASTRTNSRRGIIDTSKSSYPPVQSVRRALKILTVLNRAHIASIKDLYEATGLPKSTLVRMLDTLITDGYVARDNMCRGYHVTHKVRELGAGYEGIAELVEVARPFAINLTTQIKWPVAVGTYDDDAMSIHFWTGSISPWVHSDKLVGNRPNLMTSAMGRAYIAFCPQAMQDEIIQRFRTKSGVRFDKNDELRYRGLLEKVRTDGFALRAPYTEPKRNTTIAMPVRQRDGMPVGSITVSFFTSAIPKRAVFKKIVQPLQEKVAQIEDVLTYLRNERIQAEPGL